MSKQEQKKDLIRQLNEMVPDGRKDEEKHKTLAEAFSAMRARYDQSENSEKETFDEKWKREEKEYLNRCAKSNAKATGDLCANLNRLISRRKN